MGQTNAYFYLLSYIGQCFQICGTGTLVEITVITTTLYSAISFIYRTSNILFVVMKFENDEVETALIHLKWNLMSMPIAKNYQIVLAKFQSPAILTAGGFSACPLSVATFDRVSVHFSLSSAWFNSSLYIAVQIIALSITDYAQDLWFRCHIASICWINCIASHLECTICVFASNIHYLFRFL